MRLSVNNLNKLPELPGIYKFYAQNRQLLYLGKARNLKKRVKGYFNKDGKTDLKTESLVNQIKEVEIIPVTSEFEALLLEARLINLYQPKYNVIWKDDKHHLYIKITNEIFPQVLLARKREQNGSFFGPFPSARVVKEILSYVRSIFTYCIQRDKRRPCFYTYLDLCSPCPASIIKETGKKLQEQKKLYRKNIYQIRTLLSGKTAIIEKKFESQMKVLCLKHDFEQAAKLRDKLLKLRYLVQDYHPIDAYIRNPRLAIQSWKNGQNELAKLLSTYFPQLNVLKRIECYDVSNISGKFATASMITFVDGQPLKNFYRRFKIKTVIKANDSAMLAEALTRRFKHKEWDFPDVLVIDGGTPQLKALKKVLSNLNINIPFIGLVKKKEEIVIPKNDSHIKIKLPNDSAALHLVQRLRDEAHRFASAYHRLLRLKYLLASVEEKDRL